MPRNPSRRALSGAPHDEVLQSLMVRSGAHAPRLEPLSLAMTLARHSQDKRGPDAFLTHGSIHASAPHTACKQTTSPSFTPSQSTWSEFASPTTVSWDSSISGRLDRSVLNAFAWSLMATREYSLRGGPPPPMRAVEEMIFQILPMRHYDPRGLGRKRYSGCLAGPPPHSGSASAVSTR